MDPATVRLETFLTLLAVWLGFRVQYPEGSEAFVRIIGQKALAGGAWTEAKLYTKPLATAPAPIPGAPGEIDSVWVSISEEPKYWRAGGWRIRVAAVDAAGDTIAPSNWTTAAAGVPRDTILVDVGTSGVMARYSAPNPLKPTIYQVQWVRAEWETLAVSERPQLLGKGPIVHFETYALGYRCEICGIYHYLGLRGKRDSTVCDTARACP